MKRMFLSLVIPGDTPIAVDLTIDHVLIQPTLVMPSGQMLSVTRRTNFAEVAFESTAIPAATALENAAPRMDQFGHVIVSDLSRDAVHELLYDLGLRGLTDKQKATVAAWLEKAAK